MNRTRRMVSLISACVMVAGVGCGGGEPASEKTGAAASPSADSLSGTATIFSAASLTSSFNSLKANFEKAHPGTTITLNLGASSALAAQIIEQGGADAFASADDVNMKKVTDKGLTAAEPKIFIKNKLAIIVPPGNPKNIKGLADLAKPGLKVILAAPQVPVGRYAREALTKAGVTGVKPVSDAADVKGVVTPVTLGEADAGIVYISDIKAAGDKAAGVEIAENLNVLASYPIAVIKNGPNAEVGQAFVDLVLSDQGRKVLTGNGFIAP